MTKATSALYEIAVDGRPYSYRGGKGLAIETGQFFKSRYPNFDVTVRDMESGETTIVKSQSRGGFR
jgi:hypothetical protein